MTTYAKALERTAGGPQRLADWAGHLVAAVNWARKTQRRCDRAAAGRRLDYDTLRRIAAEAEAARPGR